MFYLFIFSVCVISIRCDVKSVPSIHLQAPSFAQLPRNGYVYQPPTSTKRPDDFPGYPVFIPPSSNPPFFDEIPAIPGYSYPPPNFTHKSVYVYDPPTQITTKNPIFADDPPIDSYLPPAHDHPQAPIPSYEPPEIQPTTTQTPFNDIPEFPPQNEPTYLPPSEPSPEDDDDVITIDVPPQIDTSYLPPRTNFRNAKANNLQIRVYNMSCIKTPTRSYFKTVIQTSRPLQNIPVIENIQNNCISATQSRSEFSLIMNSIDQMDRCGIVDCSTKSHKLELCTNIRLPTIAGLKLPEDILLTLQCKTQEKFASHVGYISMHPQEIQGRSVQSATITGGKQSEINGNAILLRRSPTGNGDFIIPVQKGASVLLGEELLLKVHIRKNDGWHYSRITEVKMYQLEPSVATPQNTIEILNTNGCKNLRLQGVVPLEQKQDPNDPLISSLPLRAFAFQGMKSGQQMIMTVKMQGCVEVEDCETKCTHRKKHRGKRYTKMPNKTEDYESEFKFKVLMPIEGGPPQITYTYERHDVPNRLIGWIQTVILTTLLICVPFLLVLMLAKK